MGDGGLHGGIGVFCKWKCPGRDIRAQVTHVWRGVQGEGGLLDPRGWRWGVISDDLTPQFYIPGISRSPKKR